MPSTNNVVRPATSFCNIIFAASFFATSFLQCHFDSQNHSHFPFRSKITGIDHIAVLADKTTGIDHIAVLADSNNAKGYCPQQVVFHFTLL